MHALIQKRQTDNKLDGEVKDTTVSSAAEILVDNNSAGDIVDALMNTNNILQKHIQRHNLGALRTAGVYEGVYNAVHHAVYHAVYHAD